MFCEKVFAFSDFYIFDYLNISDETNFNIRQR